MKQVLRQIDVLRGEAIPGSFGRCASSPEIERFNKFTGSCCQRPVSNCEESEETARPASGNPCCQPILGALNLLVVKSTTIHAEVGKNLPLVSLPLEPSGLNASCRGLTHYYHVPPPDLVLTLQRLLI